MFRANANGNEFLIRFRHVDYGVDFLRRIKRLRQDFNANGHQVLRCTECSIINALGAVIAQGMAICSPQDRFEKRAGCKLALTDAIRNSRKHKYAGRTVIDHDIASAIWKEFLTAKTEQSHHTQTESVVHRAKRLQSS